MKREVKMPDYYTVPSIDYKMVYIEPGKYIKGGPLDAIKRCGLRYNKYVPEQEVTISRGFHMGIVVVKQHQWFMIMKNLPWERINMPEGSEYPAVCVSWHDCQEFITKLNEIENSDKYRLPTDAEWEYACRAGSQDIYYFGYDSRELYRYEWFADNTSVRKSRYPNEVSLKRPNNWGLYDMLGNVGEWCQDWFPEHFTDDKNNFCSPSIDPKGPSYGRFRIIRGGNYASKIESISCAMMNFDDPRKNNSFIGFRLVKDL
jgi:formylglycine-generating enzyme required for sulfatase activity